MAINPAEFYQLGAQAGGARMGGLPEQMEKNRLMSMQLAPSMAEIPIKQQQAENQLGYQKIQDKKADAYLQAMTNQETQADQRFRLQQQQYQNQNIKAINDNVEAIITAALKKGQGGLMQLAKQVGLQPSGGFWNKQIDVNDLRQRLSTLFVSPQLLGMGLSGAGAASATPTVDPTVLAGIQQLVGSVKGGQQV